MTTAAPRRLLVVDDDPVARLVLSRILTRLGHQTYAAPDLATGTDLAVTMQPDLVFTDFELPDGTGDDLLVALRQAGLRAPVVMVTGVEGIERSRSVLGSALAVDQLTLAATLTKPVDTRAVSACLRGVLAGPPLPSAAAR